MTPHPEIDAALERLDGFDNWIQVGWDDTTNLQKPLAALIRKAAEPTRETAGHPHNGAHCHICGGGFGAVELHHAPDCALMSLVRAINGSKV